MVRAGALDGLGGPRRQLLWELGALRYEEVLVEEPETSADLPALDDWEALRWDYELLGLSPDDHPLRVLRPRLQSWGVLTAAQVAAQPAGRIVQTAGLVIVRQTPPTAKGHLFITLEDETGLSNLIVRPDLYARQHDVLRDAHLLLVQGRVQRDGKSVSMLVHGARPLSAP